MDGVIALLAEIKKLMELKGENSFKVRAFEKAAHTLSVAFTGDQPEKDLLERVRAGTLTELPGIGHGIASIVSEYLLEGRCTVRDELLKSLPKGLIELTELPGLGPKKAWLLIEELGISSIGELEYACKENRLVQLKGFGPKMQAKFLESIAFKKSTQGLRRLAEVKGLADELLHELRSACETEFPGLRIVETGELRRLCEILSSFDFLVELDPGEKIKSRAQAALDLFLTKHPGTLPVHLHFAASGKFGSEWARTTGSPAHWAALEVTGEATETVAPTEEKFFQALELPWISPELRETGEEVRLARVGELGYVLPWKSVRGVFHNHTTRSDGTATLDQMVTEAEKLGYEYIGISDHSQSAFYAQGLKVDDLREQEQEVREVQARHPGIKIFWGVESDILADGSLDYDESQLAKFDFVIASIHSRMNMNGEQMTQRILNAIRNPFTRFLGHPTGRLLLGRKGYDVDMEAIIREAAKCGVAIELNANPLRLDLDWRWGVAMRKAKAFTSINPDAHDTEGLKDVYYGVAMARKALLPSQQVVNTRSAAEVEKWLKRA